MNIFYKLSLNKLLNAIKHLQILMHVMLIDTFCTTHVESFIKSVMEIVNFEVIDIKDYMVDFLKIEESDPINIHFDASGYETSNVFLNMGPVLVIIVISPIYIGILYLLSKCCCFTKVRNYLTRVLKKTLFNRMIMFVEGIMLLVSTCAWINIYQV